MVIDAFRSENATVVMMVIVRSGEWISTLRSAYLTYLDILLYTEYFCGV